MLMPLMPPEFDTELAFGDMDVLAEITAVAAFEGVLGIYWTIEVELFFYLVYPLVIALCLVYRSAPTFLFLLFGALIFLNHYHDGAGHFSWDLPLPGRHWAGYLSVFVAGVFTSVVVARERSEWMDRVPPPGTRAAMGMAALVILVVVVSRSAPTHASIWKLAWVFAAVFFVLFDGLVRGDGFVSRVLSNRGAVALGRASYSLYLVHIIAINIVSQRMAGEYQGFFVAASVMTILTASYYLVFERPFIRMSKRIRVVRDRRASG